MPDAPESLLAPVFAAMAAMNRAVASRSEVGTRLAAAREQAERLEEAFRCVEPQRHDEIVEVAQQLAAAMTTLQRTSWEEERALLAVRRAQDALDQARRAGHSSQVERLRIELEIDAAGIWDLVGQFEQQVRRRLEAHAALAADLSFAAQAAGERLALPPAANWVPTSMGASGPDLLSALANGVRHLQQHAPAQMPDGARLRPIPEAAGRTKIGELPQPEIVRPAPERRRPVVQPVPEGPRFGFGVDLRPSAQPAPPPTRPLPARQSPPAASDPRGRLARALSAIGRVIDPTPAPASKVRR